MLSPGGRNYYVEPIDESPPPNASGVPSLDVEDDAEDASVDTLRARNAELRGMLRDASDDLARARERETAVTGALRHFRERQEKLTDELSSAAATEEEVRAAHTRCAELEIEATEHKATAEAATRRAEHAESRLATDANRARRAEGVVPRFIVDPTVAVQRHGTQDVQHRRGLRAGHHRRSRGASRRRVNEA